MRENEPADLETQSTEEAYAALFSVHEHAPAWLFHPARPLARAEQPGRHPLDRLADLQQMEVELDRIYRDYLPALLGGPGRQAAPSPPWAAALANWVEILNRRAARLYESAIAPELACSGFAIAPVARVANAHAEWLRSYFRARVHPLLVPLAVDPGRPFPQISSDSLNLLVELRDAARHEPVPLFARVKVPRTTPHLIRLPDSLPQAPGESSPAPQATYVWSGDLLESFVPDLFVGMVVHQVYYFRLLRQPSRGTLVQAVPRQRETRLGPVVRVDVERAMPPRVVNWLLDHLAVASDIVVRWDAFLPLISLPHLAAEANAWLNGGAPH